MAVTTTITSSHSNEPPSLALPQVTPVHKFLGQMGALQNLARRIEQGEVSSTDQLRTEFGEISLAQFGTELNGSASPAVMLKAIGKHVLEASKELSLQVEAFSVSKDGPSMLSGTSIRTFSVQQMAERFSVSSKTIERWGEKGLFPVSVAKSIGIDGSVNSRVRKFYLGPNIDHFAESHPKEVSRASKFSLLNEEQRQDLIATGRQLALQGMPPSRVINQLAQESGRSSETIRVLLNENVEQFKKDSPPCFDEKQLLQLFDRGLTRREIARECGQSASGVGRALQGARIQRALDYDFSYKDSEEFQASKKGKLAEMLAPMPEAGRQTVRKPPPGLPPYLASLYQLPLLTPEQERHLLRKYNLLKKLGGALQRKLDNENQAAKADPKTLTAVEARRAEADEVRNELIRRNLRLVVNRAKRIMHFRDLDDLIEEGNDSLMKAIEKFDYMRGFRLSTYATHAIDRNFSRENQRTFTRRTRFSDRGETYWSKHIDPKEVDLDKQIDTADWQSAVPRLLKRLDIREQKIIKMRLGLGEYKGKTHTLKEVGAAMGVTKERVRQLEARGLAKLRRILTNEKKNNRANATLKLNGRAGANGRTRNPATGNGSNGSAQRTVPANDSNGHRQKPSSGGNSHHASNSNPTVQMTAHSAQSVQEELAKHQDQSFGELALHLGVEGPDNRHNLAGVLDQLIAKREVVSEVRNGVQVFHLARTAPTKPHSRKTTTGPDDQKDRYRFVS